MPRPAGRWRIPKRLFLALTLVFPIISYLGERKAADFRGLYGGTVIDWPQGRRAL